MPNMMILGIHSTADVMTNSSDEMFIGNTRASRQKIEAMLRKIICGGADLEIHRGPRSLLRIIREQNGLVDVKTALRLFLPRDLDIDLPDNPNWNSFWGRDDWAARYEQAWKDVSDWFEQNDQLLREHVKQFAVVIISDDGSYEIKDEIESQLNAVRFHLG